MPSRLARLLAFADEEAQIGAFGGQGFGYVVADKAGGAGEEDFHRLSKASSSLLQRLRNQGDVLFAGGFLFVPGLDPVFPVLAGGAVFAAEFEAGDVGVGDFALVGARWT